MENVKCNKRRQENRCRRLRKLALISLFLIVFLSFVAVAKADTFDLTEVPRYLDNQLNCGTFVGGLLASIAVLCIVMLPLMLMTKGKAYSVYIIFSMATIAPLVGLGWFPVYVYIIIILLIALKFGQQIADFLGGLRK